MLALLLACPPASDSDSPAAAAGGLPEGVTASFACSGPAGSYDESSPAFVEASSAWGLDGVTASNMITADFDGDGYADLLVNEADGEKRDDPAGGVYMHRLLLNRDAGGHRTFEDATDASGLLVGEDGAPGSGHATYVAGDVDNDGDLDLFAGRNHNAGYDDTTGERDAIFLNDGSAHFTRVAHSGVGDELKATVSASFTDVDGDGNLDLWVVGWYSAYGASNDSSPPKLFQGNGDGTFVDVTAGTAMDLKPYRTSKNWSERDHRRPAYGATACDVDGDGSPELIQSSYARTWNLLFTKGSGEWEEVGEDAGMDADDNLDYSDNLMYACYCTKHTCDIEPTVSCSNPDYADSWIPGFDDQPSRLAGNTFTTVCADIDNDGDVDLYHTEIHHKWAGQSGDGSQLLLNDGTGHFERIDNEEDGLAREHGRGDWNEGDLFSAFFDYDADGWKDILLVESDYPDDHLYAWHNEGDGTFTEVSDATGLNQPWPHGAAIADFDRDGDLDVVTGSSHARSGSPWTENTLHLYENGLGGNLMRLEGLPVGTRVEVEAGGMTQTFEVSGGYGVTGQQHETALSVGLGDACAVDDVAITRLGAETTHSGALSAN